MKGLISWCRNFIETHSFRRVMATGTVRFHKISRPENQVKCRYFTQYSLLILNIFNTAFSTSMCVVFIPSFKHLFTCWESINLLNRSSTQQLIISDQLVQMSFCIFLKCQTGLFHQERLSNESDRQETFEYKVNTSQMPSNSIELFWIILRYFWDDLVKDSPTDLQSLKSCLVS